jgi:hypothetical protein
VRNTQIVASVVTIVGVFLIMLAIYLLCRGPVKRSIERCKACCACGGDDDDEEEEDDDDEEEGACANMCSCCTRDSDYEDDDDDFDEEEKPVPKSKSVRTKGTPIVHYDIVPCPILSYPIISGPIPSIPSHRTFQPFL